MHGRRLCGAGSYRHVLLATKQSLAGRGTMRFDLISTDQGADESFPFLLFWLFCNGVMPECRTKGFAQGMAETLGCSLREDQRDYWR